MTKPSFKEAIHAFEAGSGLLQAFHPFPKACGKNTKLFLSGCAGN